MLTRNSFLKNKIDLLIIALLVAAFVVVALQSLGRVPVPETDEAYTLQVAYEMVNRGQLSLPMYRYLGGNIENVWHSYTPVYFVILSGFFKLFGWGILEGRLFNLLTAALVLLMTHLIGRRMLNWRVGLIAVVMLISDQTFLERARLLRNDYAAAALGMLAYYLYEMAEERKSGRFFVASGLAAGAAVMSHTNMLYMFGAIGLMMLLRHGWRVVASRRLYQYTVAAVAVMAYEIIYDIIDYKNFVLQNREDKLHFGLFEQWGWWRNFLAEGRRYVKWYAGSEMFMNLPRTLLHLFQLLSAAAVVYLIVYTVRRIKRGDAMSNPSVRIFVVTATAALFHAFITSHKDIYYMAHLAPWFALCVGVMLNDALAAVGRIKDLRWPRSRLMHRAAIALVTVAVIAFGLQLARQHRRYLREVRNPDLASFDELKAALRSVVPDGVCPVAIKSPAMWLAFPEHDRCFATIEERMADNVDIDGKDYAVLMPAAYHKNRLTETKELDATHHLLGELKDTPYGAIRVYYTGTNPAHLALAPKSFYFFGRQRGYLSKDQVDRASEVWSAGFDNSVNGLTELSQVDLKPETIYHLSLDATSGGGKWEIAVVDGETGTLLHEERFGEQVDSRPVESLFRTLRAGRVKLIAQPLERNTGGPLRVSRIIISEVP